MNSPVEALDMTDIAYVAGIIDGEGSLSIFLNSQNGAKRGFTFIPCLTITNTDRQMLQKIQNVFASLGVSSKIQIKRTFRLGRRDCYAIYEYSAYKIMKILPYVLPYLTVKKRTAQLLFAYLLRRKRRLKEKGGMNGAHYDLAEMRLVRLLRSKVAESSGKVWNRSPEFDSRLDEAITQFSDPN